MRLTGADLSAADLSETRNWQSIADIKDANIHDLDGAPAGFVDWALKHGAVDSAATQPVN